jgi:hypothetical protein
MLFYVALNRVTFTKVRACETHTDEPCYNDIGFYDISLIESDILWYQLIPHS